VSSVIKENTSINNIITSNYIIKIRPWPSP